MTQSLDLSVHTTLDHINEADWAELNSDPFTSYRFLSALEQSGSVGEGTGWYPQYLTAHQNGKLIAAAPMYLKTHSQGEYVFDHNWAHAYENAGGRYYPKAQIASPFTPVTGKRFLTREGYEEIGQAALLQGAIQVAEESGLSSLHITFCTSDETQRGVARGLMARTGQQFHWVNANYEDFNDFLNTLSSRKRKNIRKERAQAQGFGGEIVHLTGDDLKPHHWDAFWTFYQDTGARKWGSPYLTRAFFEIIHETMRDELLMVLAQDPEPIAGALNFIGQDALYGRYWGCTRYHAALHFELCYYQAIDYAIAHALPRVEAGAQGEHKLARGYMPTLTHSLHWIRDPGFREAVEQYLTAERAAVDHEIEVLTDYGPFKKCEEDDHD